MKLWKDKLGEGRTQETSVVDDRYADIQSFGSLTLSVPKLRQLLQNVWCVNVSIQTIRNRLKDCSLGAKRPV